MTELLPAIFIACAIIGVGALVLSILLDGLLDFIDGPFGIESIATLVGVFGLVGFILTLGDTFLSAVAVLVISAISGVISAVLIMMLVRFLRRSEGEGVPVKGFIGLTGVLIQRVGPEKIGRVQVSHRGMEHIFDAVSDQAIDEGTPVQITEDLGALKMRVIDASSPYHSISGSPANL